MISISVEAILRAILEILRFILERVEQIQQFLFTRRAERADTPVQVLMPERIRVQEPLRVVSDAGSYVTGDVEITNTPLPVSQSGSWTVGVGGQPIGVTVANTPLAVSQSGTWTVGISGTPTVNAQQSGAWTVGISGTPTVNAQQSGSWTVGISGQPIRTRPDDVLFAAINATASGDTQIVAGVSGKRIRVIAYAIVANGTINVKFRSGTTDITGTMRIVEGGGIAHAYDAGLFQTAVGQSLQINLSANATVGGYVVYREV